MVKRKLSELSYRFAVQLQEFKDKPETGVGAFFTSTGETKQTCGEDQGDFSEKCLDFLVC